MCALLMHSCSHTRLSNPEQQEYPKYTEIHERSNPSNTKSTLSYVPLNPALFRPDPDVPQQQSLVCSPVHFERKKKCHPIISTIPPPYTFSKGETLLDSACGQSHQPSNQQLQTIQKIVRRVIYGHSGYQSTNLLKILVAEVMIYSEDFTQWTETAQVVMGTTID